MAALEPVWLACDLRTGAVAEELRSLTVPTISRRLGAVTSVAAELDLAGAPREWEAATDPGRTMLVAVDPVTSQPLWAGTTLVRAGGSGPSAPLTVASSEAYLDRVYSGSYSATGTDLTTIMAAVAAPALAGGPPIVLDTTASGTNADYSVADDDDRSSLSCLEELAGMQGAPEWTVDPVWADAAQTRIQLVLRIRPIIGVQSDDPDPVFDLPGCVAAYTLTESYEKGRGATRTVARGDRIDGARATSAAHTDTDLIASGWCLWEHRWTPAQGITDVAQLERHAAEALALMRTGSRAWSIQAVASASPRLGTSWALGDSIRLAVAASPRHPTGADVVARAYAWSLDITGDRVSPILLEDA